MLDLGFEFLLIAPAVIFVAVLTASSGISMGFIGLAITVFPYMLGRIHVLKSVSELLERYKQENG